MTLTTKDTGELFTHVVRGMIAQMFLARGLEPTQEDWAMICGDTEPTFKDLGEIAGRLNFQINFDARDKETPHDL